MALAAVDRRRGASPIPFVLFLLFWLVSCYFAYKYNQQLEKAEKLLKKKMISKLKLGETIPGLKKKKEEYDSEIRKLKKVLGYMPGDQLPDAVSVDNVVNSAMEKLDEYYEGAIPRGSKSSVYISKQKGGKKTEIMVNGEFVQVPIMGQKLKADKLADVQFVLNLESVVSVLRSLADRLAIYRAKVKNNISQLENRLASIKSGTSQRQRVLQKSITDNGTKFAAASSESTKIKSKFQAQIATARGERSTLDKEIQAIDKRIQRVGQRGNKDVQAYQNRIVEANKRKGNLRRELGKKKLKRNKLQYASRAELILSTVETDKPDGEILFSDTKGAWINIGRKDKVQPGLIFFVFSPAAGDFWTYRAKVQVLKVKHDISQVRMLDVADRFSPVAQGDKIFNKIYRTPSEVTLRNEQTRVCFIGKFPRYGKRLKFYKKMLERLGAKIDEKLTHWTNLVIVETDYANNADFLKATRDLNIEVLTVDQLREFIAY